MKYRALEAALQGRADPSTVGSFLVAHVIDPETKKLCAKLAVVPVEIDRKSMPKA